MGAWFGYGWAQPVTKRRWAFTATLLYQVGRATRFRVGGDAAHRAWMKATR